VERRKEFAGAVAAAGFWRIKTKRSNRGMRLAVATELLTARSIQYMFKFEDHKWRFKKFKRHRPRPITSDFLIVIARE
jgi:hypothetical protein